MTSLTFFVAASLLAYYLQLLLIGGRLFMMHRAGLRRDRQLDVMEAGSQARSRALDEQTQLLREATQSLAE